MNAAQGIGYIAAVLGAICFLPQAVKAWATRDTTALSLWAAILILCIVSLWLVYGILTNDMPIIFANVLAVCIASATLAAKLIFK